MEDDQERHVNIGSTADREKAKLLKDDTAVDAQRRVEEKLTRLGEHGDLCSNILARTAFSPLPNRALISQGQTVRAMLRHRLQAAQSCWCGFW